MSSFNIGNSPLLLACRCNRKKIFNLLLKNYAEINCVNKNGMNGLIVAAMHNSVDVLADLIKLTDEMDCRQFDHQDINGDTALIMACKNSNGVIINMLLACPLNFDIHNKNGDTAFTSLCKSTQDIKSIEQLVAKSDINVVNNCGDSGLLIAARRDDYALMKLLIEQGQANVNIQNNDKETALIVACERENIKIVKYLMLHGADPNLQNSIGFTGLLHACQRNQTKIAKLLLSNNANPNLQNAAGYTALVWASIKQNIELVTDLLNHSANPNIPVSNNSRYTALTWAVINNSNMIIKKLLDHDADPYLETNDGKTSFDYLNASNKSEIVGYYDRICRWNRRKSFILFLVCSDYMPLKKNSMVAVESRRKYEDVLSNIHLVQIICTFL